jgi:hypothetical protein
MGYEDNHAIYTKYFVQATLRVINNSRHLRQERYTPMGQMQVPGFLRYTGC